MFLRNSRENRSRSTWGGPTYPKGKGERVRFHDGLLLRTDQHLQNKVGNAFTIAGAAAGMIVLPHRAKLIVTLPDGVASDTATPLEPVVKTTWMPGDSPPAANSLGLQDHANDLADGTLPLGDQRSRADDFGVETEHCSVCGSNAIVNSDYRCTECGWPI